MILVSITGSAFCAALSSDLISRSMSSGAITSGSNLICSEAFAGQISVTPAMRLSRTALVIERPLKNASSDISSSHSTKTCSSPPKVYLLSIVTSPSIFSAQRGGERIGLQPGLEPPRMDIERRNIRIARQCPLQRHRRCDALYDEAIERDLHVRHSLTPI